MAQRIFSGYSTVNTSITGHQNLYDVDLVKQDLTNHFQTRIGERVMRPDFGCAIWDYFMEPLTEYNRNAIVAEAIRVCEADSRLNVVNVSVSELDSGVRVELILNYVPLNVIDTFTVDFERSESISLSDSFA